jgi:hypothetical protein
LKNIKKKIDIIYNIKKGKKVLIGHKNKKIVNLDNISNIYIDEKQDGTGKMIFNMNYSVKIFDNKYTPDYVYWNFDDEYEMVEIKNFIESKLNTCKNWIFPMEFGQRYVNLNNVSSIVIDSKQQRNRVIFNFNYNVTHPKDVNKLTSDFVFFNFSNISKYNYFLESLRQI